MPQDSPARLRHQWRTPTSPPGHGVLTMNPDAWYPQESGQTRVCLRSSAWGANSVLKVEMHPRQMGSPISTPSVAPRRRSSKCQQPGMGANTLAAVDDKSMIAIGGSLVNRTPGPTAHQEGAPSTPDSPHTAKSLKNRPKTSTAY